MHVHHSTIPVASPVTPIIYTLPFQLLNFSLVQGLAWPAQGPVL